MYVPNLFYFSKPPVDATVAQAASNDAEGDDGSADDSYVLILILDYGYPNIELGHPS